MMGTVSCDDFHRLLPASHISLYDVQQDRLMLHQFYRSEMAPVDRMCSHMRAYLF